MLVFGVYKFKAAVAALISVYPHLKWRVYNRTIQITKHQERKKLYNKSLIKIAEAP